MKIGRIRKETTLLTIYVRLTIVLRMLFFPKRCLAVIRAPKVCLSMARQKNQQINKYAELEVLRDHHGQSKRKLILLFKVLYF